MQEKRDNAQQSVQMHNSKKVDIRTTGLSQQTKKNNVNVLLHRNLSNIKKKKKLTQNVLSQVSQKTIYYRYKSIRWQGLKQPIVFIGLS